MADQRTRGFTLTEVLVALSLFAIAALALIHLQGENIRTAAALRDRAFATMVAENKLVEAMVESASPVPGRLTGRSDLAGQSWTWTETVSATQNPNVVRIDVAVRSEDGESDLAIMTAFRGRR